MVMGEDNVMFLLDLIANKANIQKQLQLTWKGLVETAPLMT